MIENLINSFSSFIQNIGDLSYWIVGLIFFAESIVFIGLIIPGAVVAILIGALTAQGVFHLGDIIAFATIGFVLGDCLSYYLGQRGGGMFSDENRLLKEAHLEKGQAFFDKHGNKSVFFGRFIGFLRPMTAFIAGLGKMSFRRFLVLDALSAISWTIIHIMVGYFFGQALGLVKIWLNRLEVFTLVAAILFGLFYLIKWLFIRKGEQFWLAFNDLLKSRYHRLQHRPRLEKFLISHPQLISFLHRRLTRQRFTGFPLTILALIGGYTALLLGGLVEDVIYSDPITRIDQWLETMLIAFRHPVLVETFLVITVLAKFSIIIIFALLLTLFLWRLNQKRFLSGLWVSVGGAALFSFIIKITIERPRPLGGVYEEASFSFPSAHAALSVSFYGYLLYWAWRRSTWSRRVNLTFGWLILIFLIGFSRLFLGVHYLSDVLGGFVLGLLWLLVGIGLAEWHLRRSGPTEYFKPLAKPMWHFGYFLASLAIISYTIATISYLYGINFSAIEKLPPIKSADVFQTLSDASFPRFSETIDGTIEQPMNFLIIAPAASAIDSSFASLGWYKADELGIKSLKKSLGSWVRRINYSKAPINPSFWGGEPNVIAYEKPLDGKRRQSRLQLRLWQTNIADADGQRVFIGAVSQDTARHFWLFGKQIEPDIDTARDWLRAELEYAVPVAEIRPIEWIKPSVLSRIKTFQTDGRLIYVKYDAKTLPEQK
ncbi:phosphatase PAP2 family protein [Candidatus Falkowbacteria bacterium]|nr:phosphatase PAP2 family protein [Candidatus Falkowbacteria bacterium]